MSILDQDIFPIELIITLDHRSDGIELYVRTQKHPNIRGLYQFEKRIIDLIYQNLSLEQPCCNNEYLIPQEKAYILNELLNFIESQFGILLKSHEDIDRLLDILENPDKYSHLKLASKFGLV